MKLILLGLFFILLSFVCTVCSSSASEADYIALYCDKWNGEIEVVLSDNTRVDCVTKTFVHEFEFAPKWAEAIGQSLHYAAMTGKKAKVVLICQDENDTRFITRLLETIRYHSLPIATKYIDCEAP